MSTDFNVYETVAKNILDPSVKGLLSELSKWESEHEQLFENPRKALPDSAKRKIVFDPRGEFSLYMQAIAVSHVFIKNKDIHGLTAKCKTPQEAIFVDPS